MRMAQRGYFNDESAMRRVHRERVIALAGPRALLLMAAHPVAFAGFFAHTDSLDDPYERLRRTSEVLEVITFGSREQADLLTARVRELHRQVRGTLREPAGRFPAGTPYAADDPQLLLWILVSLFDSCLLVHDRYLGTLSASQREDYWRDYRLVGKLFGLRARDMPRRLEDVRLYMRQMLTGEDLHVTDRARELAKEIVLSPPVALAARPLLELVNFITVGLLPGRLRRQYGLRWDPLRSLALAGGAQYTRRVLLPLLPAGVRYAKPANGRAGTAAHQQRADSHGERKFSTATALAH
jgi:uncharacterized protein (DUF2236 family)